MKANYSFESIKNDRQKQLHDILDDFQFVGPCGILLYRYYIMQILAIGRDDGKLKDNLSEEDMREVAAETVDFATHAVSMAADDYTEPTSNGDFKVNYPGTIEEFQEEISNGVVVALSHNFEHAFVDFSDETGISRIEYECAVAAFMASLEDGGEMVNKFFANTFSE